MPQKTIVITSGTTFVVPFDWNPSNNRIEAIGGGAGGNANGGGGGAAYSRIDNFSANVGQSVAISIGAGGAVNANGGSTTFGNSNQLVAVGGGRASSSTVRAPGGTAAASNGTVKFSGGNGGPPRGGAGGAGGPGGAGANAATSLSILANANGGRGGIGNAAGFTRIVFDLGSVRTFDGYRWATANDSTERDPISWIVQVSSDNTNWTTVDTRTNFATTTTRSAFVGPFTLASSQSFRYVRWQIDAIRTTGNLIQASEFRLRNAGADISMTGTTVTGPASQPSETLSNLVDNNTATKYCSANIFPHEYDGVVGGAGGVATSSQSITTQTGGNGIDLTANGVLYSNGAIVSAGSGGGGAGSFYNDV